MTSISPQLTGPVKVIPNVLPDTPTVEAALAYARQGFYIGPVEHGSKNPGSVLGPGWHTKTSRDPETIRAWFTDTDYGIMLHVGRSGFLVFDVDYPEAVPAVLQRALQACLPPFQSTRQGDPRRGHYVFALPAGVMLGNSTGRLGTEWGDVRGENGVIIVAPSAHPEPGGAYRWVRTGGVPELPEDLLEALRPAKLSIDTGRRDDQPGTLEVRKSYETYSVPLSTTQRQLSPNHLLMLQSGISPFPEHHRPDGELDRSRARLSLTLSYVWAGRSFEEFYTDLTNPHHRASRWYQLDPEREPRDVQRLLKRDWVAAQQYAKTQSPITDAEDARQRVSQFREMAVRATWGGRTGCRDRLVLLTCLDEAERRGGFTLTISVREVGNLAGVSRNTAQRALQGLVDAGWMTHRQFGSRDGHAGSYGFAIPSGIVMATAPVPGIPILRANDYWASLGPVARHIFEALSAAPRTTPELVQITQRAPSTVRRHLRGLVKDGVITAVSDDRWSAAPLDEIAARCAELARANGFDGRVERRREKYSRERMARASRTAPHIRRGLLEVVPGEKIDSPGMRRPHTLEASGTLPSGSEPPADQQSLGDVG